MTVVVVAVVSGACGVRVAAVTTMVGSWVTAGCGVVVVVVAVVFLAGAEGVLAFP